jgi:hypothetical protein
LTWTSKPSQSQVDVPQYTHISSASIAGNVALEWDSSAIDIEKVRSALTAAHLDEYLDSNLKD